jgi:enoyl-CoA hydratase
MLKKLTVLLLRVIVLVFEDLVVETEDNLQIVKLNRPKVNALRKKTLLELESVLKEFANNADKKILVITSAIDRVFCAGGDIKAMVNMTGEDAKSFAQLAHKVLKKIETMPKPVIAAVNGMALGAGFDLVLACDICIASKEALFGEPPLGIGIITPFGGTQRLARVIGPMRAKYLFFTGETIDAEVAFRMGIVSRVVEPERLMEEVRDISRKILTRAPVAIGFCKKLINSTISEEVDRQEISLYAKCFETRDREEGMKAFLEKRKPVFRGE